MSQNSKLSEALAATLLRFKEIDRDTIEALCKRAASLEHQVTQNTADINRETTLRSMLDDSQNAAAVVRKSHSQLQWALRDLLAQTRDLNDSGPDGEGYQSDALEQAIAVADALVGEQATEQYPIADEPLNRRIQELEVQLAEAEKEKGSVILAELSVPYTLTGEIMTVKDLGGVVRVQLGNLQNPTTADQPIKWSENALRKLVADIVADGAGESTPEHNATQKRLDDLLLASFEEVQKKAASLPSDARVEEVVTVLCSKEEVAEAVRSVLRKETQPGGRIYATLIRGSGMPQPNSSVTPPGKTLACAGLNVTVHVSPTVKGDEAMARKVRDSIFEEMKPGGAIHTAFYGK